MTELVKGFEPFFDKDSRVLILGSFPSVKSRKQNFYYGNPQNAFWRIISGFFGEEIPDTVESKKSLLSRHNIALWDIVTECEIQGSKDATIKNYKVADLSALLQNSQIKYILINGGKAYSVFERHYKDLAVPYMKLPSTSPANARKKDESWYDALRKSFS